tara:strand:+ start:879 stop:1037 length:159 start_codon:yes stop_codon:yes gene_type:complete
MLGELDVLDVTLFVPKEVLLETPITPPFDEPDLFLGMKVSPYADTQAVPFQS